MEIVTTLSELLKLAGIKEFKRQCTKPNNKLNKHSKKRKSSYKITAVEKHRNLPADFFLNESKKNQKFKSKKIILENASHSSLDPYNNLSHLKTNINKSAEETLYVSLDFIKDRQKYKKKFRNSKEDLKSSNQERRTNAFLTDRRGSQFKKDKSQDLLNEYILSLAPKVKELKTPCTYEDVLFPESKFENLKVKETVGDELNKSTEDIATFQKAEPLTNKPSLSDVARIDKSYLESVISLATNPEPGKKNNLEKDEIGKERTKKSIGKTFANGETKNKEIKVGDTKNEFKTGLTKTSRTELQKDKTSSRIHRDSTKSEVRIQLRERKNFGNIRNSEEIKIEKEVVHSKSELYDSRKKRKPRKKILNSANKEKIEIPFSSEISKAKDVKELWRREAQKKSENSLTSHSSCTIPENDENPKWKNFGLQSYRILHKLVEEEINKISKKSENKNNTKEVKNKENNMQKVHENKAESLNENIKSKNYFNKLKLPTDENLTEEEETAFIKKKLMQSQNLPNYSTYEGEKKRIELLSVMDDDSVKTSKGESKLLEETGKKGNKIPDQVIENWSILNRLEQAFLALGNSNFQNENPLKTKQGSKNNSAQNFEFPEKASKKTGERKKIKTTNQTTQETPSSGRSLRSEQKPKVDNAESVPSKRKTDDAKSTSKIRSSIQSNEENKRKELYKTEISNSLDKKHNAKESLMRKKTFNVIPLKDASVSRSQNSKTSNSTDNNPKSDQGKSRLTPTAKQKSKNNEKIILKNKPLSRSKSHEKKEKKTSLSPLKNQVRAASNEKTPPSHENYKSGIPKPKINIKKQFKLVEELLKQQVSEKKELSQKKSKERLIKERSILSVYENHQDRQVSKEKLQPIKEKTLPNFSPPLKSSTGNLVTKNAKKNFENFYKKFNSEAKNDDPDIYCTRPGTCEQPDLQMENPIQKASQSKIIIFSKQNLLESKGKLTSASSSSQTQIFQQNPGTVRCKELGNLQNLSLWERDIRRYREIVKDIMSQYKRIDGFLKQSEHLRISSSKSDYDLPSKILLDSDEANTFFNEPRAISLQEYRKKIMTEYQTLPFFEYKQLQKDEDNKLEEARKRDLSVVSDISKEMDFDVKDYQPKIRKVLDSQLYVDKESLLKIQINPKEKYNNKKLSLQEMVLHYDIGARKKHCLKSYSLPKTFLPFGGEIYSVHSDIQRQKY